MSLCEDYRTQTKVMLLSRPSKITPSKAGVSDRCERYRFTEERYAQIADRFGTLADYFRSDHHDQTIAVCAASSDVMIPFLQQAPTLTPRRQPSSSS
jgi:hypothetical protein